MKKCLSTFFEQWQKQTSFFAAPFGDANGAVLTLHILSNPSFDLLLILFLSRRNNWDLISYRVSYAIMFLCGSSFIKEKK